MKYFSTFSGIGGFELGINEAYDNRPNLRNRTKILQKDLSNIEKREVWPACIGYSEIDKYACKVYERHFPNHKNYGDITKINAEELPDFDMLIGGFPCQSFSIAGKRGGFEDTRGTLFFDLARILRAKQPRLFVFENVKGLLSHDNGQTFATIIETLTELGYDLQWQVLNSKDFGVPQNRERVFIIGHLRGTPRPQVFPIGGKVSGNNQSDEGGKTEVFPTIRTIRASHYKSGDNQPLVLDASYPSRIREYQEIAPTVRDYGSGGNKMPMIAKTVRVGGQASPYGSKQNWDSYEINGKIRRLTPKECERLQGFPDDWTAGESDTQRYKMCGNAVTVNVVRVLFEAIYGGNK